jgi:transcriptional regulator with XRE-family HTH domain
MTRRKEYPFDSLVGKVGRRIRTLRNGTGLSLRDFGKMAGLHPFHVMAIELGQLAANTKTLGSIAKALNVAMFDLFTDVDSDDGFIIEFTRNHPGRVMGLKARLQPGGTNGTRQVHLLQ